MNSKTFEADSAENIAAFIATLPNFDRNQLFETSRNEKDFWGRVSSFCFGRFDRNKTWLLINRFQRNTGGGAFNLIIKDFCCIDLFF